MERMNRKRIVAVLLVLILAFQVSGSEVWAAKKKKIIQISQAAITLEEGKSVQLKMLNIPAEATVTWNSSNYFAAKVSKKGKVKALHCGVTTVTAKYKSKYYSCTVTVPDPNRYVKLNATAQVLTEGETFRLTAEAKETVRFVSSNKDIATVNEQGLIKAVNPGEAKITAKSFSGSATCTVKVNSADQPMEEKTVSKKKIAIRRYTEKNQPAYEYISWAKGLTIRFVMANLDESLVKKVVWGTGDKTIMEKPVAEKGHLTIVSAKTLKAGTTKVTAKVTLKDGTVQEYETNVRVSDPQVNKKNLNVFKAISAGSQWQQYISFSGLTAYSKIDWGTVDAKVLSFTNYRTKRGFNAIKAGKGTMKIVVDGKTFKIPYQALVPKVSGGTGVLKAKKKSQFTVTGCGNINVQYACRNNKIVKVYSKGTFKAKRAGVVYVDIIFENVCYTRRMEVAAKGMKTIIKRANYIVNHWKYSQAKRLFDGYYDCSALVWKGYKAYKNYHKKLSSIDWPLSAGAMFDYLNDKEQIVSYGYLGLDGMKPGDLIFYGDYANAVRYSTPGRTLDIYHVSMYAGNGKVVEKGGKTITYNSIKDIVGIGRVVN